MSDETWGQLSESGIAAELDDESALRGLVGPEEDIEQKDSGFHLDRYEITPRGSPKWAVRNWRAAIVELKAGRAADAVVRAAVRAKVRDLIYLVECLKRASPKAAKECEDWHPTWVADEMARITAKGAPKPRRDPGSHRSILAALTSRQRRTWQAYRKLKTRRSRGTGRRSRGPGKVASVVLAWEEQRYRDARILRGLIIDGERVAGLAHLLGLANGDVLERLRLALNSVQDAIDQAKPLKGPQKLPQEIYGEPITPATLNPIQ